MKKIISFFVCLTLTLSCVGSSSFALNEERTKEIRKPSFFVRAIKYTFATVCILSAAALSYELIKSPNGELGELIAKEVKAMPEKFKEVKSSCTKENFLSSLEALKKKFSSTEEMKRSSKFIRENSKVYYSYFKDILEKAANEFKLEWNTYSNEN